MEQRVVNTKLKEEFYWMDTKWGCGAISVVNGVVVDSCPILKKRFTGKKLRDLLKMYNVKKLGD